MSRILFTNVEVLDCTGADAFAGQVLVEGERIKEVWRAQQAPRVDDAQRIDGRGGTLMPGLIEPHAHLTFTDCVQSVEMGFIPVEEHLLITLANARTMLEAGFTSCFSAASAKKRLDIVLRNAIEAGKFPGPAAARGQPRDDGDRRAGRRAAAASVPRELRGRPRRQPTSSGSLPARCAGKAWTRSRSTCRGTPARRRRPPSAR